MSRIVAVTLLLVALLVAIGNHHGVNCQPVEDGIAALAPLEAAAAGVLAPAKGHVRVRRGSCDWGKCGASCALQGCFNGGTCKNRYDPSHNNYRGGYRDVCVCNGSCLFGK